MIDLESSISSSHSIVEQTLTYQLAGFISSSESYTTTLSLLVVIGHFALIATLVRVLAFF